MTISDPTNAICSERHKFLSRDSVEKVCDVIDSLTEVQSLSSVESCSSRTMPSGSTGSSVLASGLRCNVTSVTC
jgi:hypothetical protein